MNKKMIAWLLTTATLALVLRMAPAARADGKSQAAREVAEYVLQRFGRQAVREGHERVERLTEALRTQTEHWRMKPLVAGLSSLRGIDFVAAVTLAAEIGDFSRFAHPSELMGKPVCAF